MSDAPPRPRPGSPGWRPDSPRRRPRSPTRRPGRVAGAAIRGLIRLLSWLPLSVARALPAWLADLAWPLGHSARAVTEANLEHCRADLTAPERAQLGREAARQTAMLFAEQGTVWHWPRARWDALIDAGDSRKRLDECGASERGTLMLVPHLGNWELFSLYLGAWGITALYDPPRLMSLDAPIRAARERNGATLLPIDRQGLKGMLQALADGGLVALLPDQVPAPTAGVYAPFFGQPALTMTLAHRLITRSQPRVLIGALVRDGTDRHARFRVLLEEAPAAITAREPEVSAGAMNEALERMIRRYPEQYQWSYKRFKRPPPGQPKLY
ncbi:MAG: lysophospholipid acyltransferase family protein [Pseudomonadota bacterium]